MTKILVVEDEASFSDALSYVLGKEGFDVTVADTGDGAIAAYDKNGADLVLLDLMLPNVPIIMLTAKDTEVDKVVGLELGADDYVTKPYSKAELVARIKAVLRRGTGLSEIENEKSLKAGPVEIDVESHKVKVNGEFVTFPLKEFELLEFLVRNSGRVLTRTQLIDRIWGSDYFGDTKTLDVHIKRLRAKIEKDPANPVLILTIRGLGYKFEN
jgi:two-component system, OmpR family, response regulator RegX3